MPSCVCDAKADKLPEVVRKGSGQMQSRCRRSRRGCELKRSRNDGDAEDVVVRRSVRAMSVYEVLTIILVTLLAMGATAAIYIGLIGMLGGAHFVPCARCGHLTFSASKQPHDSCVHCRHPVLMHSLHALIHPRQRHDVRVRYRKSTIRIPGIRGQGFPVLRDARP